MGIKNRKMITAERDCRSGHSKRLAKNWGMVDASSAWVMRRVGPARTNHANKPPQNGVSYADPHAGKPKLAAKIAGIANKDYSRKIGSAVCKRAHPGADVPPCQHKIRSVACPAPAVYGYPGHQQQKQPQYDVLCHPLNPLQNFLALYHVTVTKYKAKERKKWKYQKKAG